MATTIRISEKLQKELAGRRFYQKETYEEVIWELLEDRMKLGEDIKRLIKKAEKDLAEGKVYTHKQVKKELGISTKKIKKDVP